MKILLGTDILLYYLFKSEYVDGIHQLFNWINKIKADKIVDISSIAIITHFIPISNLYKLQSCIPLKIVPPLTPKVHLLRSKIDTCKSYAHKSAKSTLAHINLLDRGLVDFLITENEKTHHLAQEIGLDSRIFTIERFIEKCTIEYRELDENKGVAVSKCKFGSLSIEDSFFYDFKKEYNPYFVKWFHNKANDEVFVSADNKGKIKAFLKLKVEDKEENYSDIHPTFSPCRRLKISSFKVDYNGQKLGERFIRIITQEAISNFVDEVYFTIFNNNKSRKRLIKMLKAWGFEKHGEKMSSKSYNELVFVKKMRYNKEYNLMENYPFHQVPKQAFIIPLNKTYIYQLLPQDTLFKNDLDIIPAKRAIKKVVILKNSHVIVKSGSGLLFHQISSENHRIIAVGIAEKSYTNFDNYQEFYNRCRKRSLLSNNELMDFWNKTNMSPMVIEFLYICGIEDTTIDNSKLETNNINTSNLVPLYPTEISTEQYINLLSNTSYEMYFTSN